VAIDIECSISECGRSAYRRGWCCLHYTRWLRHSDPLGGGRVRGEPETFLRQVVLQFQGDECLHWPYSTDDKGYGQHWQDGKLHRVNRLVCEASNGSPPTQKHEAAHSCGNGHLACCTPKHLRWATRKENVEDTLLHGTRNSGERCGTAKLKEYDVRAIRALKDSLSQHEIGAMFNTSQSNVNAIISRRT